MSYMKGDLLSKTRKLVKGLAKATPTWLKAMEEAPPVTFPLTDGKIKKIELPEDVYVKKFFRMHPDSLYHDAVKISGFDPPPARVFGWRVVELKEQGVSEAEAIAVADMEYRAEKKAKKKAYRELKQVCLIQGKKPPPNPYPSAIKEIQAEEKKIVRDRFFNPKILEIVKRLKEEHPKKAVERDAYYSPVKYGFGGRNNNNSWGNNNNSWGSGNLNLGGVRGGSNLNYGGGNLNYGSGLGNNRVNGNLNYGGGNLNYGGSLGNNKVSGNLNYDGFLGNKKGSDNNQGGLGNNRGSDNNQGGGLGNSRGSGNFSRW